MGEASRSSEVQIANVRRQERHCGGGSVGTLFVGNFTGESGSFMTWTHVSTGRRAMGAIGTRLPPNDACWPGVPQVSLALSVNVRLRGSKAVQVVDIGLE